MFFARGFSVAGQASEIESSRPPVQPGTAGQLAANADCSPPRPIAPLEAGPMRRFISVLASSAAASWLAAGLLIAAVFIAYRPSWHGDWLWDDGVLVLYNPLLKSGQFAKIWVPGNYLNFWPVSYAAYWLEIHLFAFNPFGFHLVNIGLHAVAAILLWRLLARLRLPGALLAAGIFAMHPVNVESVAWISQLRGILSLDFALISVLLFLSDEQELGPWTLGLSLAAFVLSALAKGAVLTLPLLLLALAWWQRGRIERQDIRRVLAYTLIAAVTASIEIWTQHLLHSAPIRTDGLFSRAAIAGCAVWFYLGKFVWPLNLFPIYPRWSLPAPLLDYLPLAALLVGFVVAWRQRDTWGRAVVMFMFCYVTLLLPVLGFVNITYMEYSLVADHWQYVAMIVPCAAAAAGWVKLSRRWWPPVVSLVGGAALIAILGVLTFWQSAIFIDNDTLFARALVSAPNSWLAEYNLAVAFEGRGQPDKAIAHYERAIAIKPDYARAHNNLAKTLLDEQKYDAAIVHLELAIKYNPQLAAPNCNLALALEKRGDFDGAIAHLRRELEINPASDLARHQLAKAVSNRDLAVTALTDVRTLLRQTPKDAALLNTAAWILATSPYQSLRNGVEAVRFAELASKINGGDDPYSLGTLAVAYAEAGRFEEAVSTACRARELANRLPDNGNFARQLSEWIAQFNNKKPVRDLRMK